VERGFEGCVQERNERFLSVFVAENLAKCNIVFYVCGFHIKQFDAKVKKYWQIKKQESVIKQQFSLLPNWTANL